MQQVVQFILVPDGSAARRSRRMFATQFPCQGTLIGTRPELIEQAKSAYLISLHLDDWKRRYHTAPENLSDAFWCFDLLLNGPWN